MDTNDKRRVSRNSEHNMLTNKILLRNKIANSYANIERLDKCVNKIYMPAKYYKYVNDDIYKNSVSKLWGADIHICENRFDVVCDEPYYTPEIEPITFGNELPLLGTKLQLFKRGRNLTFIVKSRAIEPFFHESIEENRAINTLREMITETEFRRYIKYGFILVKASSGFTYQIFRNRSHTKVWQNGKLIKEICVRIKDSQIPPTDNVIAFKTIIEMNEAEFCEIGNVYKFEKAA